MRKPFLVALILVFLIGTAISLQQFTTKPKTISSLKPSKAYWFMLYRKSNTEYLYFGTPGVTTDSALVKTFKVKSGIPVERPTPLPQLLGREYFILKDKFEVEDNTEVSPYFLTLDIPVTDAEPFGPTPYLECNGQCNWILPGAFGLHGVGGDPSKLSDEDLGSSGCIRHLDKDITFLYYLLDPKNTEVRYYIEDI